MTGEREEPQRVLGIPLDAFSRARDKDREEPQRVLGFPVDWLGSVKSDVLDSLERHVRDDRGRARRRRPGPQPPSGDDPPPEG